MSMSVEPEYGAPTKAVIGWLEPGGSKRDTMEHVKDYATKHFDSPNSAFYALMPFLGGWLYELHENGPGLSYLPAAAQAMAEKRDPAWFRVGQRAFSVTMRDKKPYCVLKPEKESQALFDADVGRLQPRGKMNRLIRRGTGTLIVGSTIFGAGSAFMVATGVFHLLVTSIYVPEIRRLDVPQLPHRAWAQVDRIPPNLYVEALRFQNNQWTTSIKPIVSRQSAQRPSAGQTPTPAPVPVPEAPQITTPAPMPPPVAVPASPPPPGQPTLPKPVGVAPNPPTAAQPAPMPAPPRPLSAQQPVSDAGNRK